MIYIHIPFCASKCFYCDFYSVASRGGMDDVLAAMVREIEHRRHFLNDRPSETLYFGGGTPSILSIDQFSLIVDALRSNFDLTHIAEFTVEANPEHLNLEYLEAIRSLGVNRLSIGIQSFVDSHLEQMNRHHTSLEAQQAVRDAQQAGFDNISIDLIYGLPSMSESQWATNIETAIGLDVQHISAYHLSIEEKTVFGRRGMKPIDECRSVLQYNMLCDALREAGFDHYEISNFAQPTRHSRHNSGYWRGVPYLGIGPAAHSFDGVDHRSWNVSSNKLYAAGAAAEGETLTAEDTHNEYLMIHLRTKQGVDLAEYNRLFGRNFTDLSPRAPIAVDATHAWIPEREWLIADALIATLFI
ncbi:MAG: radical SAM family heme chaperone HemW [Mucinivorans sp.]